MQSGQVIPPDVVRMMVGYLPRRAEPAKAVTRGLYNMLEGGDRYRDILDRWFTWQLDDTGIMTLHVLVDHPDLDALKSLRATARVFRGTLTPEYMQRVGGVSIGGPHLRACIEIGDRLEKSTQLYTVFRRCQEYCRLVEAIDKHYRPRDVEAWEYDVFPICANGCPVCRLLDEQNQDRPGRRFKYFAALFPYISRLNEQRRQVAARRREALRQAFGDADSIVSPEIYGHIVANILKMFRRDFKQFAPSLPGTQREVLSHIMHLLHHRYIKDRPGVKYIRFGAEYTVPSTVGITIPAYVAVVGGPGPLWISDEPMTVDFDGDADMRPTIGRNGIGIHPAFNADFDGDAFNYASLYPSIMHAYNLQPHTMYGGWNQEDALVVNRQVVSRGIRAIRHDVMGKRTTTLGRQTILQARAYLERHQPDVRYGYIDTVETPESGRIGMVKRINLMGLPSTDNQLAVVPPIPPGGRKLTPADLGMSSKRAEKRDRKSRHQTRGSKKDK